MIPPPRPAFAAAPRAIVTVKLLSLLDFRSNWSAMAMCLCVHALSIAVLLAIISICNHMLS